MGPTVRLAEWMCSLTHQLFSVSRESGWEEQIGPCFHHVHSPSRWRIQCTNIHVTAFYSTRSKWQLGVPCKHIRGASLGWWNRLASLGIWHLRRPLMVHRSRERSRKHIAELDFQRFWDGHKLGGPE
jgi:hypothetical protein